jgi:hypothetical protein
MSMREALRAATGLTAGDLRCSYRQAVARGARNTACPSEQERGYGTLRLLTLALLRLPDLALYAHLAHVCEEEEGSHGEAAEDALLLRLTVCEVAAGALRLTHRALETHGRHVGYEVEACRERVLTLAREELQSPTGVLEAPVGIQQARRATVALTRATAASASDPMLFCEELSRSLGHLLVIYVITREPSG